MVRTSDLSSEDEKHLLEHDAAKLFMRCYEKRTGKKIRHIWHNQPRRPDTSCLLEDERLDLEIAHLYGSEEEARQILKQGITRNTQHKLEQQSSIIDLNERLVDALNSILLKKSEKQYDSERVWLVIRNAHPAWEKSCIAQNLKKVSVPLGHVFEQIWVVADFKGETGIVQLFPSKSP
ncbi:hypothetical protein HF888_01840 [Bermanella marisrubri]|uniref:Uncharacterized protein n=1 Tax=Bermanella marisrubri TaxID=207949 RepID=Q1N106_9GAMM|nr:hypothetical protein [Bermanella marisrubri]EAT11868.1 hypothetical protein RED65_13942 [Oceanobacter sp. RED65] [Bermanella marisrubri]QIZ83052.1 hypothetical protein HF888_01840 [Bermanella marisrubri]